MTPQRRRDKKITWSEAHALWFCGLRGAMAYALSRAFPDTYGNRNVFVVTTMVIALVTIFFFGGLTSWLLDRLRIRVDVDEEKFLKTRSMRHFLSDYMKSYENDYIRRVVNFDEWQDMPSEPKLDEIAAVDKSIVPGAYQRVEMQFPASQHRQQSMYDYGQGNLRRMTIPN
jgi:NhaP-type Na+/H+ or K+/H+ antiporter